MTGSQMAHATASMNDFRGGIIMTYIILAAGKGSNLYPLTLKYAKTSFRLDENSTVLQRMVRSIRKAD